MAESGLKKGTVTAVGSLFPAAEAQKASNRVHDAISDRQKELDRLRTFIADNSALTKLVRELPDDLSHDVMVPFGSAAFFPGRLIHTNEFLVLLGDGYYAERTAKQTVEILKRREKALEAQMEALKATLLDLEAESKFFDSTAADAKEGLVEIREEYIEEPLSNESESVMSNLNSLSSSKVNNSKLPDKEEEHARIMARLDELEKEELEAESASGSDEDEDAEIGLWFSTSKNYANDDESGISKQHKSNDPVQKSRGQEMFHSTAAKPIGGGSQQHLADQSSILDLKSQFASKDGSSQSNMERPHTTYKPPLPPDPKENLRNFSTMKLEDSSVNIASQTSKTDLSERKAFTGSVIEHSHGLPSNQATKSTTSDQPSKPVSRFKMQKGNR